MADQQERRAAEGPAVDLMFVSHMHDLDGRRFVDLGDAERLVREAYERGRREALDALRAKLRRQLRSAADDGDLHGPRIRAIGLRDALHEIDAAIREAVGS